MELNFFAFFEICIKKDISSYEPNALLSVSSFSCDWYRYCTFNSTFCKANISVINPGSSWSYHILYLVAYLGNSRLEARQNRIFCLILVPWLRPSLVLFTTFVISKSKASKSECLNYLSMRYWSLLGLLLTSREYIYVIFDVTLVQGTGSRLTCNWDHTIVSIKIVNFLKKVINLQGIPRNFCSSDYCSAVRAIISRDTPCAAPDGH